MIPYFSFALVGAVGLLGSSILFPLIALAAELIKRRAQPSDTSNVKSLDILIPASHNAKGIESTLSALNESIQGASFPVQIQVAGDAYTDNRWKTLRALIDRSQAEWVALVESGTLWTQPVFVQLIHLCEKTGIIAVAPNYEPSQISFLEDLHWKFEQILKQIESDAGGPIHLHSATIFYRRAELLQALLWLDRISSETSWISENVVIPLAMRATHPQGRIDILSLLHHQASVTDSGVTQIRETRANSADLQWMNTLLGPLRDLNPDAYWIAMRQVFRVFWAYWVLFIGMGALHSVVAGIVFVAVAYFIPQRSIWNSFQALWQWRAIKKAQAT